MNVEYNTESKIWKSLNYNHLEYIKHFIGEIFLENFKKNDNEKVIELHYDTGVTKTMADIYRDAVTLAINFQKLGVKKGDIVVIYSLHNSKISCLTMGALMLGAAVNFFDTTFNKDVTKYTLELLSPNILVYEENYKPEILEVLKDLKLPSLKYQISIDGKTGITIDNVLLSTISSNVINNFQLPNLGDPQKLTAFILFTSGSTGLPKAVALSHSQLLHGVITLWPNSNGSTLLKNSVIFSFSPIRWMGPVLFMLQSLLMSVKRVYASGFPSVEYGIEILRNSNATHLLLPPSLFKRVILSIKPDDLEVFKSMLVIFVAGEAPEQFIIEMANKLAPKTTIMKCYGMTELAGCISYDKHVNGGYIKPGIEVKMLDDNLKPVGPNNKGQLCVRLPMPYLGYYKIDNTNIYYTDGFLNTGDYGYMDDNNVLHIFGRFKDLVRMKTVTLIPSEVEQLICRTFPNVSGAVLVGYRSLPTDFEDKAALFIVKQAQNIKLRETSQQSQQQDDETLKAEAKNVLLNHYKSNESCLIRLVNIIDKFPLTSCGKCDKPSLIQLAKTLDVW